MTVHTALTPTTDADAEQNNWKEPRYAFYLHYRIVHIRQHYTTLEQTTLTHDNVCQSAKRINQSDVGKCQVMTIGRLFRLAGHLRGTEERGPGDRGKGAGGHREERGPWERGKGATEERGPWDRGKGALGQRKGGLGPEERGRQRKWGLGPEERGRQRKGGLGTEERGGGTEERGPCDRGKGATEERGPWDKGKGALGQRKGGDRGKGAGEGCGRDGSAGSGNVGSE